MKIVKHISSILMAALTAAGATAYAQGQNEITITKQPSILYLPALVMEKQGLIEKAAAADGIKDLKVNWRSFSSGGASTDALLSGNVQIVNSGLGNLLLLWDRTKGQVKGITTNSALPLTLVSRDPKIKTLKDFGPKDKIAVPTVRISTQAILLQMACEKAFGKDNWAKLDVNTVQLGHPDAAAMLANPKGEISSHFAAPPYDYKELKTVPNAHVILRSNDVIDGGLSQSTLFTTTKFADANPKIIKAVLTASKEAIDYIKANTEKSVEIYREISGDKTSVPELLDMLKQPGMMDFQMAPAGSMKFAEHMHKVGILKTMPKKWTDYFLPASASLNGN
ncbi:ABC transporter substrate-binding protein [Paralcaligenes sp. KSB-10]|uniref:ABC transporter substrate-binding protein n=1 Tax=Paralcaligenes sp. KSB-10 TaxID=2901142 RepID=UPI001E3FE826|nr:ABC transporter substrate-binding protein [Paralcaligenes sp. KSB-10]UHL63456.1 ABC transporter substrate-binding protein [Paralcaligenes sp. KSB-10]